MIIMKPERVVLVVTDGRDYSIKEVSEWLLFYSMKENFQIIVLDVSRNGLVLKNGIISDDSDLLMGISDTDIEFNLNSLIGIFFRQTSLRIVFHSGVTSNSGASTDIKSRVHNYLMAYEANIRYFILNCFSEKNIIGYDSGSFINKLDVLKAANEVGINTPATMLIGNKKDLQAFHAEHTEIIVKSAALNLEFFDLENKLHFRQLTHAISENDYSNIPDAFQLSLVQKKISKEFEIRTFYLDGECYSWALLSQSNDKTTVDNRNYDLDKPMRVVPFKLPNPEERHIKYLMKKLLLRTGSIDLIYSTNKEYIFLEVNPAGQYGYNAVSVNDNIDKKLAEALIFTNDKKKHRTRHS